MGGLLTVFRTYQVNFFLDFQNIKEPTGGDDFETYTHIKEVLNRSNDILALMENYQGCSDLIYTAISEPTQEHESSVFERLLPSVLNLQTIYEYSLDTMRVANSLLSTLCRTGSTLENQEALAKLLCDLFNFVLQFDDKKMMNPHINNDFSYYRRSAAKLRSSGVPIKIPDDVANKMSLFFAYPTPMMNMLNTQLVPDIQVSKGEVVSGLATFANVCLHMVEQGTFTDRELNIYCLRAMTASIILVDHISEEGVFCKKTPVNIRQAIQILKNKVDVYQTTGLINALKYTTKHLNDEATPEIIINLINE